MKIFLFNPQRLIRPQNRKASFTLLEMLIVMMLIAILFGVGAFHIPKAIKQEKFQNQVKAVKSKLELAEKLSLDYWTETRVIFSKSANGYTCVIEADRLPEELIKRINRLVSFEAVASLRWNGKVQDKLTITFSAPELFFEKGELVISGSLEKTLILPGIPGRINAQETYEEIKAAYPEEIRSFA